MSSVIVHGGTTDDGPAINAALSGNGVTVICPDPVYNIKTKVLLNSQGQKLIGGGRGTTKFMCSASAAAIGVAPGTSEFQISDFDMQSAYNVSFAGQNGIDTSSGVVEQGLIKDIKIGGFWQGLCLGPTSDSYAENILITDNFNTGLVITNRFADGGLQWDLYRILSQQNNGLGYLVEAVKSSVAVGDYIFIKTYANLKGGFAAQSVNGNIINSLRLLKPFFGQDGGDELLLSTGPGSPHQIVAPSIEAAGRAPCGVGGLYPATMKGHGIVADATVGALNISGGNIMACSWAGISLANPWGGTVNGAVLVNNGAAKLSGELCGVYLGGSSVVTGCLITGHAYNVFITKDAQIVANNDLRGYTNSGIASAVPLAKSITTPNLV